MDNLDLYKFLQSYNVQEYRIDEQNNKKYYLVWIRFFGIEEFVDLMKNNGADLSAGEHDVNLQDDCICVDLNDYCFDVDLDKVFGEDNDE